MFRHERQSLFAERQLRGKTLVRNLATASAEAILSDNELNLFSYCKDIIENEEDARYVIILNTKGKIIAHNNPEYVGKTCDDALCDTIRATEHILIIPTTYNGENLYNYSMPMIILEKRIGSVRVLMSNESILRKMEKLQKDILTLSLVSIAVGLLLTFLLVHFLFKPIGKLSEGASIIGSGNFLHRIPVRNRNEIEELAQAFNSMGDSLQKRKSQIASLNETSRALNTTLERDMLLNRALDAIQEIITPRQCLLCLFDDTMLVVKKQYGLDTTDTLSEKPFPLPDDINTSLFSGGKAAMYPYAPLAVAFEGLSEPGSNANESILIAPLVYEDKKKGAFILIGKTQGDHFSETDREFSEILAAATTISLLNIELLEETAEKTRMEAELKTAETVRQTLFPKKQVAMEGIEVYGYFKSASETGGDWYGYTEDSLNKTVSIYIGDVTGHGVPAALVTATANSFIKTVGILQERYASLAGKMLSADTTALPAPSNPSYLLSLLNNIIYKSTDRQLVMTFFATTIDLNTNRIYYANGGHEMPIIIHVGQGNQPEALTASGTRPGDKPDIDFEQQEDTVHSGDIILFYTDGITECLNPDGEEYGSRRFLRKIKKCTSLSAEEIVTTLISDVQTFSNDEPLHDDITLVVAKIL